MTEPDEDVTELSARNKESEDVTLLSERVRATDDVEDDVTRFSPRTPAGVVDTGDVDTADQTRLSRRAGHAPPAARSGRSGAALSPLPPGVIGGAAAERGAFGQPVEEYDARALPPERAQRELQPPRPIAAETIPQAGQSHGRREAARHRRLVTAAIVVGVTAAAMTAAVLAIIAVVNGS